MALRPGADKIALVAYASSRNKAPFHRGGPDGDFELWGCNVLYKHMPERMNVWDRWFEPHEAGFLKQNNLEHWDELKTFNALIYMHETQDEIKNSVAYPVQAHIDAFGDYFTSGIAYMLGMALMECLDFAPKEVREQYGIPFIHKPGGGREIHLYGIHMASDEEYHQQRACCEYLLGIARGTGIPVVIPDESSLLKSPRRYGFHHGFDIGRLIQKDIEVHNNLIQHHENEAQTHIIAAAEQRGMNKALESLKKKWLWDEEREYMKTKMEPLPHMEQDKTPDVSQLGDWLAEVIGKVSEATDPHLTIEQVAEAFQAMRADDVGIVASILGDGKTFEEMVDGERDKDQVMEHYLKAIAEMYRLSGVDFETGQPMQEGDDGAEG